MSAEGRYTFLPWLRRGVSTQITREDGGSAGAGPRASFPVNVSFNGGQKKANTVHLDLYGPGEVAGFDLRAVTRTWPAADVFEAESNFFPLIEFDQVDLPWRYTSARATGKERLRPWLCLIVLREAKEAGEIEVFEPAGANRPFPTVVVKEPKVLPQLDQAWSWAHVQSVGEVPADTNVLSGLLGREPHRFLARLMSPRRLEPRTPYVACLVPTFERGRLAGLGNKVDSNLDGLAPAWKDGTPGPLRLPVYHQWRFQTGGEGDFESLVRRLEPRILPDSVGKRDMAVNAPGAGLPAAASHPLALEGALRKIGAQSTPWSAEERRAWTDKLKVLLNKATDQLSQVGGERILVPPLYGRWHAAKTKLEPGTPPRWLDELNTDPRLRVAAGLGTQVVQEQREALLASAWQQVDRIRAINEELRLAQLAREAAVEIHERHLKTAGKDALLTATGPVQGRIVKGGETIAARFEKSPIPAGVFEPQWRRVSRRFGSPARRQGSAGTPPPDNLLERLNKGQLSAAPPPAGPSGTGTLPPEVTDPKKIDDAPPVPNCRPYHPRFDLPPWRWVPHHFEGPLPPPGPDEPVRKAAKDVITEGAKPPKPVEKVPVDLDDIRTTIIKALDPRDTIGSATAKRLRIDRGLQWQPEDPIEPILAAPEFPQPMYEPLRDLSQDLLFPGLEQVPADTLAVLSANSAFLEAYMVGLNHEMARTLLFNEYPTDQRGSCFRQFWDVRGNEEGAAREELYDIPKVHGWKKDKPLGGNSRKPAGNEYLVLLVRGELLRRYPGTIVYAAEAIQKDDKLEPGTVEKHPAFHGTMKPDVAFLGFDLTPEKARGGAGNLGWFFVLQEQPAAPCFGLAVGEGHPGGPPIPHAQLTWGHFATDPQTLVYLDLAKDLPPISDGSAAGALWTKEQVRSSDLAFVTQRRPVRIAIHAALLLPPS